MSFNIPSFPDLPSLPTLPSLASVLPPGLPSGSFSDMISAAAAHVGMADAVQQAQAQIQSVAQLQSFGVAMPPNVMSLAHSALESVTNFSPTSMFKNPAADVLGDLSSIGGAMTSSLTSALSIVPTSAVPGIKDIMESVSSVTRFPAQASAEICTRISSLSTDVPVMMNARYMHNQMMVANAAVAATMPPEIKTAMLDSSFPGGATKCAGLNLDTVFAPVKNASGFLTGQLNGVLGGVQGLYTGIKDAAGNVLSGAKAFAQHLMNTVNDAVSSIVGAVESAIGGLVDGLKSTLKGFTDMFTPMISGFKQMVQDAKDMMKQAINIVKSFSLVNLLGHKDPCVKDVMSVVVQPHTVDPVSVTEMTKPTSQQIEVPVQTAIARAAVNAPLPELPTDAPVKPQPVPPLDIPNPYTKDELEAFKPIMDAQKDVVSALRKQSADDDVQIAEWRKSVNFQQKGDAANPDPMLTRRDPGFGIGRSPDPAVNAAWKEVFDQHRVKIDAHNLIRNQIDTEDTKYQRMYDEYSMRAKYGKTPYTTQKQLGIGDVPRPDWARFTFLDSGI